jgi:hypothetical protein
LDSVYKKEGIKGFRALWEKLKQQHRSERIQKELNKKK